MFIDWLWIVLVSLGMVFLGIVIGRRLGIDEYHRIVRRQIRSGRLKENESADVNN